MVSLRFLKEIGPGTLTSLNNSVCCFILLPFVRSELSLSLHEGWLLAVMGIVQLEIPRRMFSKGVENVPIQEASLIVSIEPVLNPIWVAFAVGEIPSKATLIGGGLIVGGLGFRYLWQLVDRKTKPVNV